MLASFNRSESLKSRKRIRALFESGESLHRYPLRLVWRVAAAGQLSPIQVAFSVPKRRFKRAVKRNRIKRLMREAYRLQKQAWYAAAAEQEQAYDFMFIYTGKEELPLTLLERKLHKLRGNWEQICSKKLH